MKISINVADESVLKKLRRLGDSTFEDKLLLENLNHTFDRIQNNPFSGTQIPKKLIPLAYSKKYRMKNLWKRDLRGGWRLLYFLVNDKDETYVIIVDWMSHQEYDRLFHY